MPRSRPKNSLDNLHHAKYMDFVTCSQRSKPPSFPLKTSQNANVQSFTAPRWFPRTPLINAALVCKSNQQRTSNTSSEFQISPICTYIQSNESRLICLTADLGVSSIGIIQNRTGVPWKRMPRRHVVSPLAARTRKFFRYRLGRFGVAA